MRVKRAILAAGDTHLGAMAVPYALAIHEDYLKTILALLQRGKRLFPGRSAALTVGLVIQNGPGRQAVSRHAGRFA